MKLFKSNRTTQPSIAWILFAVLAAVSNVAWAAVGYVHEASGEVRMQNGSAVAKIVKAGDTFDPGVTFETSGDGKAVIKFEDGQLATMQPNTKFSVDSYSFSANNPKAGSSAMRMFRGAMRFVTGLIGSTNRGNVKLAAGTATIGIRGTDITLVVNAAGAVEAATVVHGSIALQTSSGTANVGAGQFSAAPAGQRPSPVAPIAAAPIAVQAVVNTAAAAVLPRNTPVAVRSAANAAIAVAAAKGAKAVAAAATVKAAAARKSAPAVAAAAAAEADRKSVV